jgi:hypothetical protein
MNNTLKVQGSISVEKEITLPYFCKHGQTFYKAESEEMGIVVSAYDFSMGIEVQKKVNSSMVAMSEPCTEDDFLEALYKVSDYIQKQIPVLQ